MHPSTSRRATRVLASLLALILGITALQSAAGASLREPDPATIAGTVTAGGVALEGATVHLLKGGEEAATDTTAADGTYFIDNLSPGSYLVYVTGPDGGNYIPEYYEDSVTSAGATGIPANPGHEYTEIDVDLDPTLCVEPGPGPFPDVPPSHPFCPDIEWLADAGITGGYSDGTFRPLAGISRQAMAAFLYRYAGDGVFVAPDTPTFPDVPATHPFFLEIEWLASSGIATGYADGNFHPADLITRQAIAAFIYRLAGSPTFVVPGTPTFPDASTSHPFFAEIEWLASTGVSQGYIDGTYRPTNSTSRQAMAAFLHRFDDMALLG